MQDRLTALVVMAPERSSSLLSHLQPLNARVLTARSCAEAARRLEGDSTVKVILTDLCLPDGSWFDVLNRAGDISPASRVVVCARVADERLWSQILEAGGFDMVVEPFEGPEVRRILSAAAHPTERLAAVS